MCRSNKGRLGPTADPLRRLTGTNRRQGTQDKLTGRFKGDKGEKCTENDKAVSMGRWCETGSWFTAQSTHSPRDCRDFEVVVLRSLQGSVVLLELICANLDALLDGIFLPPILYGPGQGHDEGRRRGRRTADMSACPPCPFIKQSPTDWAEESCESCVVGEDAMQRKRSYSCRLIRSLLDASTALSSVKAPVCGPRFGRWGTMIIP